MINQETLNNVISNMNKIQEIADYYGFKDVCIFKPLSFSDSKKLNLVATQYAEGVIDFFSISDMGVELSKLLNCKIFFLPDDSINSEFEELVMKSKILLIEDNKEKITNFFYETLKVKKENHDVEKTQNIPITGFFVHQEKKLEQNDERKRKSTSDSDSDAEELQKIKKSKLELSENDEKDMGKVLSYLERDADILNIVKTSPRILEKIAFEFNQEKKLIFGK